jgi:hypothetical protein
MLDRYIGLPLVLTLVSKFVARTLPRFFLKILQVCWLATNVAIVASQGGILSMGW